MAQKNTTCATMCMASATCVTWRRPLRFPSTGTFPSQLPRSRRSSDQQSSYNVRRAGMALLGEHRGSIQDSMPQCTTHTFLRMDTYNAAFDDVTLVNKFCSIAFSGTIMRTLIVSHGSGSLTVAQALHTGACQLGTRTAWYMASPPLAGSEVRPVPDAASSPLVPRVVMPLRPAPAGGPVCQRRVHVDRR